MGERNSWEDKKVEGERRELPPVAPPAVSPYHRPQDNKMKREGRRNCRPECLFLIVIHLCRLLVAPTLCDCDFCCYDISLFCKNLCFRIDLLSRSLEIKERGYSDKVHVSSVGFTPRLSTEKGAKRFAHAEQDQAQ